MNNRVKEVRNARNISQEALAFLAGCSRETIRSIENGGDCRLSLAMEIADSLGCTVHELWVREGQDTAVEIQSDGTEDDYYTAWFDCPKCETQWTISKDFQFCPVCGAKIKFPNHTWNGFWEPNQGGE